MKDIAASQVSKDKIKTSCPLCGKSRAPIYRPFCSKACAETDLGRWLGGGYAIPTEEPGDQAAEE